VEQVTIDRVQQMINDEAADRFPEGVAPRLVLLRYGDHPEIEPGELYLRVILEQDHASHDAWIEEHFDRLEEFRMQRLPEVKGFILTTEDREAAGCGPTGVMKIDGISLLDPEQDEIARGLTQVGFRLEPVDVGTLDALITAGIAASRSEATRWALARVREQPACANLSEPAREPGAPKALPGMDRVLRDRLRSRLDKQVKERYPDGGVQRVALLQYGDDPHAEPGDLIVRVFIEEAEEDPPLRAWDRDNKAMIDELHDELKQLEEQVPGARYLEVYFGSDTGHQGRSRHRHGGSPHDPAGREGELISVEVGLGLADLEMLDALITSSIAASRVAGIRWALALIRDRPAYTRLSERARELGDLRNRF
jgi:hypothetical protein